MRFFASVILLLVLYYGTGTVLGLIAWLVC